MPSGICLLPQQLQFIITLFGSIFTEVLQISSFSYDMKHEDRDIFNNNMPLTQYYLGEKKFSGNVGRGIVEEIMH